MYNFHVAALDELKLKSYNISKRGNRIVLNTLCYLLFTIDKDVLNTPIRMIPVRCSSISCSAVQGHEPRYRSRWYRTAIGTPKAQTSPRVAESRWMTTEADRHDPM